MNVQQALANPGNLMASLFLYTPPRLHFTRGERSLLRHALRDHTDAELAEILEITQDTVKSHWRAICNRVSRVMPDLLPGGTPNGARGATRRPEKRHLLLAYLRRHPEELRPGLNEPRRPR